LTSTLYKLKLFLVENLIWFINLGLIAFFSVANPSFLSTGCLIMTIYCVCALGFLVYAQSIAIISGNMDMSVGAIAAFASVIVGKLALEWAPWIPWPVLIILYPVIGAVIGAYNGVLIGKLKINSFLQTLSVYLLLYGIIIAISPGTLYNLPEALIFLGSADIPYTPIPFSVVVLLLVAIILHIILSKTRFGRHIYAIGGNEEAARACGIIVDRMKLLIFVVIGILSAIAGLLYTGYQMCVSTRMAKEDLFRSFAGAIIGGVSLRGGRGEMKGIVGGILLMGIIDIGLTLLNTPAAWRTALNGAILGVAIIINETREKIRWRLLARAQ